MPSTVLLIRHPESAWNRRGIYQGQRESRSARWDGSRRNSWPRVCATNRSTGIICSPLQRAATMARAIARYHNLTPEPDARLTEIAHGPWEGLSRAECEDRYPDLYRRVGETSS